MSVRSFNNPLMYGVVCVGRLRAEVTISLTSSALWGRALQPQGDGILRK